VKPAKSAGDKVAQKTAEVKPASTKRQMGVLLPSNNGTPQNRSRSM